MSAHSQQNHTPALVVLTTLFFMMGFITCMNDILIPHLKDIFDLTYVQAMLIQFCFFTAYAIMSIPMGYLVGKIGYKNGVIGGFLLTAIGCLLFYPAAGSHSYATFLGALFILASGVTLLQVAGNPYVTLLSKPGKESATLTLVQAFNSLGTTIAPQIGAFLILADATQTVSKAEQISSVQIPYLGLAGLLIILAVFVKMIRLPDARKIAEEESEHNHDGKHSVWQYHHLFFGAAGIFCYVGAEVSIGSLLVSVLGYLKGLDHASAAKYLSFYLGGAMVGCFLGSASWRKLRLTAIWHSMLPLLLPCWALLCWQVKPVQILRCGHCWPSASSTPLCSQRFSLWQPKVLADSPAALPAYCVLRLSAVRLCLWYKVGQQILTPDDFFRCISDLLCLYRLLCYKRLQS